MHEVRAQLREYNRARAYTDELWKDLSPDEVTWRPHENFSAIGWHLGHQAHVAHFMIRNLTAAEPSPDPALDGLMDSALPEQFRGALPTVRRLSAFRVLTEPLVQSAAMPPKPCPKASPPPSARRHRRARPPSAGRSGPARRHGPRPC